MSSLLPGSTPSFASQLAWSCSTVISTQTATGEAEQSTPKVAGVASLRFRVFLKVPVLPTVVARSLLSWYSPAFPSNRRAMAGTMTERLHTANATPASRAPTIASQTPGTRTIKMVWARAAMVVTNEQAKTETRRKRTAEGSGTFRRIQRGAMIKRMSEKIPARERREETQCADHQAGGEASAH